MHCLYLLKPYNILLFGALMLVVKCQPHTLIEGARATYYLVSAILLGVNWSVITD